MHGYDLIFITIFHYYLLAVALKCDTRKENIEEIFELLSWWKKKKILSFLDFKKWVLRAFPSDVANFYLF
jgi:hypothetical protein